ncbi:MAG: polymer-forming cytoskeletal protein [Candidatus Paceibacterota bacterium]|jgi:hypothetical protein|nr:polymer-forming cytoskeletal protein [bacterium]
MKKYFYSLLAVAIMLPFGIASAITMAEGESILSQGVPIEGNAFLAGSSVTIDNEVNGDAFAFGERIYVNGKINGDLICAGREVIINGEINGNIRCASEEIKINGKIERSVLAFGKIIIVEKNGSIGRDLIATGQEININGIVAGSLDVTSSILKVNGTVNQNINFYSEEQDSSNVGLFLNSGAIVNGNVNYNAFGEIKNNGGNITGVTNKYIPKGENKEDVKTIILSSIGFIIAIILTTLAIVVIGGSGVEDISKQMTSSAWKSVGIGAISFFMLPIIGIILIITGIGAFLGIVCLLMWILILLLSLFFSGISLGEILIKKILKKKASKFLVNSLIGVLVGYLLLMIPFLGFIFFILGLWWGVGGTILAFAEKRKEIE